MKKFEEYLSVDMIDKTLIENTFCHDAIRRMLDDLAEEIEKLKSK